MYIKLCRRFACCFRLLGVWSTQSSSFSIVHSCLVLAVLSYSGATRFTGWIQLLLEILSWSSTTVCFCTFTLSYCSIIGFPSSIFLDIETILAVLPRKAAVRGSFSTTLLYTVSFCCHGDLCRLLLELSLCCCWFPLNHIFRCYHDTEQYSLKTAWYCTDDC